MCPLPLPASADPTATSVPAVDVASGMDARLPESAAYTIASVSPTAVPAAVETTCVAVWLFAVLTASATVGAGIG